METVRATERAHREDRETSGAAVDEFQAKNIIADEGSSPGRSTEYLIA